MTTALSEPLPTEAIPGTTMAYHSVTYGFLVGELVRRVTGRSLGNFFRSEVAEPLGADFHIGFGPELDSRVAETVPAESDFITTYLEKPDSLQAKVFHNPPAHNSDRSIPNTRARRGAELPSVNGHQNAQGLARIYGELAQGSESGLLSPAAIERCGEVQMSGDDAVTGGTASRCLGFSPTVDRVGAFGHGGQGGSVGFADPVATLGFGYVPNRMILPGAEDPRRGLLIEATYACLG